MDSSGFRGRRSRGAIGGGAAGAAVESVPDVVGERVAVAEGGRGAGGGRGLVDPDPLGRPSGPAGPAEVEVADPVPAGAPDLERVLGAPREHAGGVEAGRVRLVPVRVPERQAHRVRRPRRGIAARLDLHRVPASPGADVGPVEAAAAVVFGFGPWERPEERRRGQDEVDAEQEEAGEGGLLRPAPARHGWIDRDGDRELVEWTRSIEF